MVLAVVMGALGALLVVAVVWAVATVAVVRHAGGVSPFSQLGGRLRREGVGSMVWLLAAAVAPVLLAARLVWRLDVATRARPVIEAWSLELAQGFTLPVVELPAGASS